MIKKVIPWVINDLDLQLFELALQEDLGLPYQDRTTDILFSKTQKNATAKIISKQKEPIVICGLPIIQTILDKLDKHCEIHCNLTDGEILAPGETLLTLKGPAQALLKVERTLLNFLQRLCAVASLTAKYVDAIKHTPTQILDTRKTQPGFRHLEKYAVHCGGGVNHRMGLYDAIMIKDTHIDFLGGIQQALNKLPDNLKDQLPIIIEVRNVDELNYVLDAKPKITRVLLDNMSLELLANCVTLCRGKIPTEASGNMQLKTIAAVAETGVNFISVGKITHSAGTVDLSMQSQL